MAENTEKTAQELAAKEAKMAAAKSIVLKASDGSALAPVTRTDDVIGLSDLIKKQGLDSLKATDTISLDKTTEEGKVIIKHDKLENAVTNPSLTAPGNLGDNIQVLKYTVDEYGHTTGVATENVALPTTIADVPEGNTDKTRIANLNYVDNAVARVTGALYYIGAVNSQDDLDAIESPATGDVYVIATAFGTYDAGDMLIYNGAGWDVVQGNIDGAVTAANDLTTDTIVLGNGTHGVKSLTNGTEGQHLVIKKDGENLVPAWETMPAETEYVGDGTYVSVADGAEGTANDGKKVISHAVQTGLNTTAYGQTEYDDEEHKTIKTLDFSDTFVVPNFKVDAAGHITEAGSITVTLPDAPDEVDTKNVLTSSATGTEAAEGTFLNHVSQGTVKGSVEFAGDDVISVAGANGKLTFSHAAQTAITSTDATTEFAPEYAEENEGAGDYTYGTDGLKKDFNVQTVSTDDFGHVTGTSTATFSIDLSNLAIFSDVVADGKKLTAANANSTLTFGDGITITNEKKVAVKYGAGLEVDSDKNLIAALQFDYVEDLVAAPQA